MLKKMAAGHVKMSMQFLFSLLSIRSDLQEGLEEKESRFGAFLVKLDQLIGELLQPTEDVLKDPMQCAAYLDTLLGKLTLLAAGF